MEQLKDDITVRLIALARDLYGIDLDPPGFLYPPSPELGDLAVTVAFDLAKRLRRPPRAVAEEIAGRFGEVPGIARIAVAGGGYLNLFIRRGGHLTALLSELGRPDAPPSGGKVIIEHTNINPNKAAHIGHLRNAALGDTLARCLRFLGRRVEVQNYIDDTGVQVADLAVGITHLEKLDLEGVRRREAELAGRGEPLDHYCWDLYARVTDFYEREGGAAGPGAPSLRDRLRGEALKEMEEGTSPLARIAAYLAEKIVHCHLVTLDRIGVRYDLLPRESDILAHRFWESAFAQLQRANAVHLAREGKNAGCWVMSLADREEFAGLTEGEKILVRSNGTVTYVGKDIAYQLWKLGLLDSDFAYRRFLTYPDGREVWATAREGEAAHPPFGRGETIYNVIDVRQSYLQKIVSESLQRLGHPQAAARSIHFSYEMVALSPRGAEEMGIPVRDEDRSRPYLEMSGRKGLGVKADDLVDSLLRRAEEEVSARNPDLAADRRRSVAREIAVGALRYYMLRFTRNKVIAFDQADALAFEGETGPYVQYSAVRAAGILAKLRASLPGSDADLPEWASKADLAFLEEDPGSDEWELVSLLGRHRATVEQAVDSLEFSTLAKYAFVLAQKFNAFYHKHPVLHEPDPDRKRGRALVTHLFRERMTRLLGLMGIGVPPLM